MEAVAVAAAAMVDLNTLSRRELQALCKLNGVRANMTNVAMVEALQSLASVDGIDQVGTTLCLPTPGKSAMKSALRTAAAASDHQQQQGSPLPRGRRVSVKSPEAIRMDAEEEDETKWDLTREIVRTPGVALRSTSRRARATPAPLPTPAAGTLRRSQRSAARKATAPAEEVEVSTVKRSTRKTARSMAMMIDLDQEEEDAKEENKVRQVEQKGVTSDEKCHVLEEEQVTNLPEEGNSKGDEPEQGEEGAAIVEELKLVNAEKSAPLSAMEGSPILGVLSKATPEPAMKKAEDASTEDGEGFGNWSPVLKIADEINSASEDKEVVAVEVPEEVIKVNSTVEAAAAAAPNNMVSPAVTEKEVAVDDLVGESSEEAGLTEESSEVDDLEEEEDMLKVDRTMDEESDETIESAAAPNIMVPAAVTEKEVSADDLPQADLTDDESAEEYELDGESSEDFTVESSEVDMLSADRAVDEESDYTIEDSDEEEEQRKMLETGEETKEVEESDSLTGEEDDFSGDLSSEFDDLVSDAETESDSSPVALEAASSAAKTVESVITEDITVSIEEGGVVSQHVETIVESLDKVTITEEKKEECAKEDKHLAVAKDMTQMSLRKLKSAYKESLIAAKLEGKNLTNEGSRMVLAELDNNAEC